MGFGRKSPMGGGVGGNLGGKTRNSQMQPAIVQFSRNLDEKRTGRAIKIAKAKLTRLKCT